MYIEKAWARMAWQRLNKACRIMHDLYGSLARERAQWHTMNFDRNLIIGDKRPMIGPGQDSRLWMALYLICM